MSALHALIIVAQTQFCPLPTTEEPHRLLRTLGSIENATGDVLQLQGVGPLPGVPKGTRWFVLDKDAPCAPGKIAVRTRTYPHEKGAGSLEQAYYTTVVDSKRAYCVDAKIAQSRLRATILPVKPKLKTYPGFAPRRYTALPLKDPNEVSFSIYDKDDAYHTDRNSFVHVRTFTGTHEACPNGDCMLIQFEGPMYSDCGCKPQGFTLLVDKNYKAVEFLSSTLRFGRIHQTIPHNEAPPGWNRDETPTLKRLLQLMNDRDMLAQAFRADPRKGEYLGKSSLASQRAGLGEGSGVTVATAIVLLAKVRARMLGKDNRWPTYDKPQPI